MIERKNLATTYHPKPVGREAWLGIFVIICAILLMWKLERLEAARTARLGGGRSGCLFLDGQLITVDGSIGAVTLGRK
ncbi:MAG TPA: hypothetical protein VH621_02925 [Nitrososphaera sp.]